MHEKLCRILRADKWSSLTGLAVDSRAPQASSRQPCTRLEMPGTRLDLSPATCMLLTRGANFFTFFLRIKSVLIASAAAIPEPGTALGLGVVVPFQHKVPAGALVFLQPADIHDYR